MEKPENRFLDRERGVLPIYHAILHGLSEFQNPGFYASRVLLENPDIRFLIFLFT